MLRRQIIELIGLGKKVFLGLKWNIITDQIIAPLAAAHRQSIVTGRVGRALPVQADQYILAATVAMTRDQANHLTPVKLGPFWNRNNPIFRHSSPRFVNVFISEPGRINLAIMFRVRFNFFFGFEQEALDQVPVIFATSQD